MAQRAYRQRKESTLDELKKRVSELAGVLENMNRVFTNCKNVLVASGLPDVYALPLYEATSRFAELVAAGRVANDYNQEESGFQARPSSAGSKESTEVETNLPTPKNVSDWIDQSELVRIRIPAEDSYLGMGYSIDTEYHLTDGRDDRKSPRPAVSSPDSLSTLQDILKAQQAVMADATPASPELSTPLFYSFQETTFARRLHRACLEGGYQMLLDPTRRPEVFERVFMLPLLLQDREQLLNTWRRAMRHGAQDYLSLWTGSSVHIGGAGTHYPRRDELGQLKPRKTSRNLGRVALPILAMLLKAGDRGLTADMTVEVDGYEGEWLDPLDVEGYLNEKGIYIDPRSSFAEAEIDMTLLAADFHSTPPSSSASASAPFALVSTEGRSSFLDPSLWKGLGDIEAEMDPWNDANGFSLDGLSNVGYSDASTGSWMNFVPPNNADIQSRGGRSIKRPVTIDVSKFITGEFRAGHDTLTIYSLTLDTSIALMNNGVCLGRTPGFRRNEIDKALAISCFDA